MFDSLQRWVYELTVPGARERRETHDEREAGMATRRAQWAAEDAELDTSLERIEQYLSVDRTLKGSRERLTRYGMASDQLDHVDRFRLMGAALMFYANPVNYTGEDGPIDDRMPIGHDKGLMARQALGWGDEWRGDNG